MSSPKRIRRKRTKGWRMPEGAVYVGRPTIWGNPFAIDGISVEDSIALYRNLAVGCWAPTLGNNRGWSDEFFAKVYSSQHAWGVRLGDHPLHLVGPLLGGKDLACWCPLEQPCHADVLLELANAEVS